MDMFIERAYSLTYTPTVFFLFEYDFFEERSRSKFVQCDNQLIKKAMNSMVSSENDGEDDELKAIVVVSKKKEIAYVCQ